MKIYKAGLIGVGGFGVTHTQTIMDLVEKGCVEFTAFADTRIDKSSDYIQKLLATGALYYKDYREMLRKHPDMDFVSIASPIHFHKQMSIEVMEKGMNVLLEKPPAVTIQDIDEIIETRNRTGKVCAVNFQMTSCKAFLTLLKKLRDGELGQIQSVTGVCLGKGKPNRYNNKAWAGRLKASGLYVLDGTINNPHAHTLNNCLIAAGYGDALKAVPEKVQAELYRAYDIESEDTSCMRVELENGVEVRFYATLRNKVWKAYHITISGSEGKAVWRYNGTLDVTGRNGNVETYSFKENDLVRNIYENFLDVMEGKSSELFSSIDTCRNFVLTTNGAFESCPETVKIPDRYLDTYMREETEYRYIVGIEDIFNEAASSGKLLSQVPVEWGIKTRPFSLKGYSEFRLYSDK